MRILVAHNRYQTGGGEDAVVRDEVELLQRHGHSVELLEQDNDAIHGLRGKLIASASVFYSCHSRERMKSAIHDFRPEIVHIHNWFPMLSPSIILEAGASSAATVQTLHNFRMLCANALLYRDGRVCTDCVGKLLPVNGVVHGCYRSSRAGSAIVTATYAFHRLAHTWDCVDLFVAVSEFQRKILIHGGLPEDKVIVKPNFVGVDTWNAEKATGSFALYVGRLSTEKGIRTLLSAWNTGKIPLRLKIIGDGPMAGEVRACSAANSAVEFLGLQSHEVVYNEMAAAKFLVFPSEWFEGFARTVVEAFSQGTPILAANLGAVSELVEDGITGYRFLAGNAGALIAGAMRFLRDKDYARMRANCRHLFLGKFTAEINYTLLMEIYGRAIANSEQRQ